MLIAEMLTFASGISNSSVQKCINLPQKHYLYQENAMFRTVFKHFSVYNVLF